MKHIFDVIIIGGGPAGYTAGLYCTRSGFDTVVVEKHSPGGQMCQTLKIDNYPGFDEGIDGFALGSKMQRGAEKYGARSVISEVVEVDLKGSVKVVKTAEDILYANAVIISTGAEHRRLGIENEERLTGRGVGYCATCDGMLFKNKTVAVSGGGNSAVYEALYLSKICKKVYIIHRRDSFRASKIYVDRLLSTNNIEICWESVVENIIGDDKLKSIKIRDINTDEFKEISCDGLFVSIGRYPETRLFENQIELDGAGYIIADETTRTNVDGVFAAGDVRTKSVRQIVTAVADGAVAAYMAEEYLK